MDLADFWAVAMNAPQEQQSEQTTVAPLPVPAEAAQAVRPREIDGRDGPEPTRYGDWEKAGRCIDF